MTSATHTSTTPTAADEGLEWLTDKLISHVVFDPVEPKGRQLTEVITALRYYGTTAVTDDEGIGHPAPCDPESLNDSYPGHQRVRRLRGVTFEEEQAAWAELKSEMNPRRAVAPRDVIDAYIASELRAVVQAIILDGPYVFIDRGTKALQRYAASPIAPYVARPDGGHPMQSTINSKIDHLRRVLAPLFDPKLLRVADSHPAYPLVRRWRSEFAAPPPIEVEAVEHVASIALGPPTLATIRLFLANLNREIYEALGVSCEEEVIPAIEKLSDRQSAHSGLHRLLRNRAVFLLFAVVGQRIDAGLRTNRADLDVTVTGGAGTTKGVRHTPGKTKDGRTPRVKPLPEDMWRMLAAARAHTDRVREAMGLTALVGTDPLFLGDLKHARRCSDSTIYRWLVENLPVEVVNSLADPSERDASGAEQDVQQKQRGYSAHTLRKLARSLLSSKQAEGWADQRGLPQGDLYVMGETLLDHWLKDLAAIYNGWTNTDKIESNSGKAIAFNWELLTADLGLRKTADVELYGHALIQQQAAISERSRVRSEMQTMFSEARRTGNELSPTAIQALAFESENLSEAARAAELTVERVESGRLLVAVPDDAPDPIRVDFEQIKADVLGPSTLALFGPRVRNWLTPEELATILGVGASTVRGWLRDGLPANKQVWLDGAIHEFSTRRRAIRADLINELFLDTPEKQAMLAAILATNPPAGWTTFLLFIGDVLLAA